MARSTSRTEALFLSTEDIAELADPAAFVDAVRDAYRQRGGAGAAKPRTILRSVNPSGRLNSYTAILPETGVMGGYMYSAGFGGGAWFMTPLFDATNGEPLALVDGVTMNPFKTGAAGAVGIDTLAREDASELAVIGSGRQARGQLRAAVTVRDFDRVSVYSPTAESREAFAAEMDEQLDPDVVPVETPTAALDGVDVVITATTASEPVFDGEDLPDGAHVTAIGQYTPTKRELDSTTMRRATYVPDLRDRAFQDAGSFLLALQEGAIPETHVHAELGEIVAGKVPGRTDPDEITVFDSGGTALETVAGANLLYERATQEGLGTPLPFTTW